MSFYSIRYDLMMEKLKSFPGSNNTSMNAADTIDYDGIDYTVVLSLLWHLLLLVYIVVNCYYHDDKKQQISRLLDENYMLRERINKLEQEYLRPIKSSSDVSDSRIKLNSSFEFIQGSPVRKTSLSRLTPSSIRKSFSVIETNTKIASEHVSDDSFISPLENSPEEEAASNPVLDVLNTVGTALNVLTYLTPSRVKKSEEDVPVE